MDVFTAFDAERIEADRAKGHAFWLDLDDPPEGEIEHVGEMLGLHPLAIEDTREFGQRPKVDVYDAPRAARLLHRASWTRAAP